MTTTNIRERGVTVQTAHDGSPVIFLNDGYDEIEVETSATTGYALLWHWSNKDGERRCGGYTRVAADDLERFAVEVLVFARKLKEA